MSQTLHLLKKDLRALWLPLALLYALLIVQGLLALQDPLARDEALRFHLLPVILLLSILVTAAMLVQQEPLVGTTAFWLTRPIRRGALVAAKAIFLICFVIAPVMIAQVGVLEAFGLESHRLPTALLEILVPLAPLLVGAVLLAAVTPSVPIYSLTWIGVTLAFALVIELVRFLGANSSGVSSVSRDVVWAAATIFCGGLLVLHQYLTRRTRHTIVVLAIGFIALVFIRESWRWEILNAGDPVPASEPIELTLRSTAEGGSFPASREPGGEMRIAGKPAFLDTLPQSDLEIGIIRGKLHLDQGATSGVRTATHSGSIRLDGGAVEAALPGFQWVGGRRSLESTLHFWTTGPATFDDLVGKTGTLQAEATGNAYRYRPAGTVPLTVGARFEKGSAAAVVRRIAQNQSELQVAIRYRHIKSNLDNARFPRIVLVNPEKKEMIAGSERDGTSLAPTFHFLGGPLVLYRKETLVFPLEFAAPSGPLHLEEPWLSSAELAFLERIPAGLYKTRLRLTNFRTRDTTVDQGKLSSSMIE